jgi:citrate synthase
MFAAPVDEKAIMATIKRLSEAARNPPGFNHTAYPKGDPRAALMLSTAQEVAIKAAREDVRRMRAVIDASHAQFGTVPSIELGLVVLARGLGLPNRGAGGLFALGRSAGWVAHILEQRLAGFLIRPRAKFV